MSGEKEKRVLNERREIVCEIGPVQNDLRRIKRERKEGNYGREVYRERKGVRA